MRFAITYGRKARAKAYDMVEISLYHEFDERVGFDEAFYQIRDRVERWVEKECDRILAEHGKRPAADMSYLSRKEEEEE